MIAIHKAPQSFPPRFGHALIAKLIAEFGSSIRADGRVNPVPVVAHLSIHSIQTFLDIIAFYTDIILWVEFKRKLYLGNKGRVPRKKRIFYGLFTDNKITPIFSFGSKITNFTFGPIPKFYFLVL